MPPPAPRLDARICASATAAPFLQSRRAETRELLTSPIPPGRDGSSSEPDQRTAMQRRFRDPLARRRHIAALLLLMMGLTVSASAQDPAPATDVRPAVTTFW